MPQINQTEQLHLFRMYGTRFEYRCDKCRCGISNVVSKTNAERGGKTFCLNCDPGKELKATDTVEWVPKITRAGFMGIPNDPNRPEMATHCTDCGKKLVPSAKCLAAAYIVIRQKVKRAICFSCYQEKEGSDIVPRVRASAPAEVTSGDVSKMQKVIFEAIRQAPKTEWNVGVLFAELPKMHKPTIREAVRQALDSGSLVKDGRCLKLGKI